MTEKVLVTVGMKCPKPLFEVHKCMKNMTPGQILEVQADDPAFKLDIEAWCRRTGNDLLNLKSEGSNFIAQIKKCD
jgi:TusA-related sulfurtransferase